MTPIRTFRRGVVPSWLESTGGGWYNPFRSRAMAVSSRWFLVVLLTLTVVPTRVETVAGLMLLQETAESEEPPPPKARSNPLLRQFFRDLYPSKPSGGMAANEEFLDRFVDRQIDRFVEDIDVRLGELVDAMEVTERLRTRSVDGGGDREEVRRALAGSLRRIGDLASGLSGRLAMVFRGLERRKRLEIRISPESRVDGFVEEVDFIGRQVTEADRLVRDYLFRGTNTVTLEDLGGEDMLVRLDWAEKMSREVARALR